jgi:hypothetical protein
MKCIYPSKKHKENFLSIRKERINNALRNTFSSYKLCPFLLFLYFYFCFLFLLLSLSLYLPPLPYQNYEKKSKILSAIFATD